MRKRLNTRKFICLCSLNIARADVTWLICINENASTTITNAPINILDDNLICILLQLLYKSNIPYLGLMLKIINCSCYRCIPQIV
ncbi:TPA: hypothetical protein KON86_002794 [Clostridioides difficile]|nr:hypothetical protein [Clostridioides difficile]HBF4443164.1 hypothetical protein [Clostridioides difficile]HBG1420698.1 hypothetical protein [Clostridioides difficile]